MGILFLLIWVVNIDKAVKLLNPKGLKNTSSECLRSRVTESFECKRDHQQDHVSSTKAKKKVSNVCFLFSASGKRQSAETLTVLTEDSNKAYN